MRRFLAKLVLPVVLRPKSVFTTGLELAGFGLIVYGISRISVTGGLIAAGVCLILVGVLVA